MRVSILTDDIVNKKGVIAEHGLSLYIEHRGVNILFDTGQSYVYCHNAEAFGIDLKKTDFIVLSHGHYDHCGGLANFPKCDKLPLVYAHPKSFNKRYHKKGPRGSEYEEIGIPWGLDEHPDIKNSVVFNTGALEPYPGMHLITEITRTTDFEILPKELFAEESGDIVPDTFTDEQMLVIETGSGLVCILGCSHPGVINCLNHVNKLFPEKSIYAVIAGMHMEKANDHRIEATINSIQDLGVQVVVPLHCTGIRAISEMKKSLRDRCLIMATGASMEL